jgi:hypothetical protein
MKRDRPAQPDERNRLRFRATAQNGMRTQFQRERPLTLSVSSEYRGEGTKPNTLWAGGTSTHFPGGFGLFHISRRIHATFFGSLR